MNHSLDESPLLGTSVTAQKMEKWVEAQRRGEKIDIDVYGKPTEKQLRELEHVRNLSKELQDNLHELENSVRIAEIENQDMTPTAPVLDYSEDHEFVSANHLENCYDEEDKVDAREEEKRKLTKGNAASTAIQNFYKDQCVFVTGGTGFLGKVLIEKLLRSCSSINTIYVLIRNKKGKDYITRLNELLDEFLFHKAHEVNPKGIHKVVPINGDLQLPGLGISDTDRKILTSNVSIIINAAATVKFDEKLSVSTAINVKGTKEVLKLAKECRNLKAVTHVSTAFSNTHVNYIEEKFYESPMAVEALEAISELDDHLLDSILPSLLDKRPNTYCFTKAVAEEAVRLYGEGLPVCIVRPSIVLSTYEEPMRGWTDSVYGPTGLVVGIGTGVIRTMYMDLDKVADMVPVDLTVNAILASAWHTARNFKENQTSDIPIYNYVSGAQNPIKWRQFIDVNRRMGINTPTTKAVWYYGLNATNSYYMFLFYNFFLHYLPALLVDLYRTLCGKRRKTVALYNKVMRLSNTLFYFSTRDWKFENNRVREMWSTLSEQDKIVFPFNMSEMSWEYMSETFLLGLAFWPRYHLMLSDDVTQDGRHGIPSAGPGWRDWFSSTTTRNTPTGLRVYLLKDDLSTLPEARKKWNRLFLMHLMLKLATFTFILYLVYILFRPLFSFISVS